MFELFVDNKLGTLWVLTRLVTDANLKTVRIGAAGKLDFTLIRNPVYHEETFEINCGDLVQVRVDGKFIFYGFIFSIEESDDRTVRVTAYDQLRYLMEADTYVRANITATEVIRDQAQAVGLNLGELADTGHAIPTFSMDGQKRLDMIYKALDETTMADGRIFVFYDDAGNLVLRDIDDMVVDLILGDGSLVYGYNYKRDIDEDTYNRVKFVKDNKETGSRETYVYENSVTIERWGRLQYYQKVGEKLNEEQINAMGERFLELKNREQQKFTIDALGYPGVRAGVKLQVTIKELGADLYYLVEECTHHFNGDEHTMQLELRVYAD